MLRRRKDRLFHLEKLLVEHGFTREEIDGFRSFVKVNNAFPAPTERFSVVEESDIPGKLGISWLSCPGHSQSDLVFRVGNYAVTGDVLLRNIYQSPLLDVDADTFNGRFRNYDVYCSTIAELVKLRGSMVLPGHRYYVESVDDTIVSYVRKMLERAGQVKKFADVESVRDVTDQLFEEPLANPFYIYLKVSEIIFMRDFLADPGRLGDSLETIGLLDPVSDLFQAVAA
jgi:2,4-dienoyl-CoA reductase (NADPH2)